MKIYAGAIALALTLASQPASAQKWTGFHVAIGGGVDHVSTDGDITTAAVAYDDPIYAGRPYPSALLNLPNKVTYLDSGTHGTESTEDSRGFGSVELGYDYRINRDVVVGGFASFDFGELTADNVVGTGTWQMVEAGGTVPLPGWQVIQSGNANSTGRIATKNAVTLGARLGYLVHPKTMVYVLGGYSATQAKIRFSMDIPPLSIANRYAAIEGSSWRNGYSLGGGIEAKLTSQFSAKLEYRHSDYGSYGLSGATEFTLPATLDYPRLDGDVMGGVSANSIHSNSVRLMLSLRL